jgi:hypothetical protein
MPGLHHLGVVEELGDPDSALCDGVLEMLRA